MHRLGYIVCVLGIDSRQILELALLCQHKAESPCQVLVVLRSRLDQVFGRKGPEEVRIPLIFIVYVWYSVSKMSFLMLDENWSKGLLSMTYPASPNADLKSRASSLNVSCPQPER